ncbi:hypothetical protein LCGC14_2651950 [marine sediment metagenome]|uniref:Uncharacterized protein n=1 Tax=marine sediment metagenome TaxID=412755 RepID=A0A0F8ZUL5_9ZZZZ
MKTTDAAIKAEASGFYNVSIESEIKWILAKPEHTFLDAEAGFAERPEYVVCLKCDKATRYSTTYFNDWAMEHGEMCRS